MSLLPGALLPSAKVLLVDDNPANLLALCSVLEELNVQLVEAASGEDALRLAEGEDFAVVLLDVLMPGLGGFATAERLRRQVRSRRTPIIFVTAAEVDQRQLEEGYCLGAVDFLTKPIVPIVLQAKVRGFLELFDEQRQAKREADQLRLLVQGTIDYAIFMLDPHGRVATWNLGAERLKGYQAVEIIGEHFSRFYTEEAKARAWPQYELTVAEADGRFEDEGWRVRKDGTQFWANVVITALRGPTGELLGFSKITRDMTERKRAEDNARRLAEESVARRLAEENAREIEDQRERLRVTLASIGDAVISTDANARVTFLNPAAEQMVGWSSDEAAGRSLIDVFHIIDEETREPIENPSIQALRYGHVTELTNHTVLVAKDGSERSIDDSAAPIRDSHGSIVGSVLVFRDISPLKAANEALQRADRRKDEFLATLAHELRNPLAPIRNSLQILKMPRVDAETARQTRETMERQVQLLVRLVDDLLDVSRVMRGKIELRKEFVELATIVARAVETVKPLIEANEHHLDISLPTESLLLNVDPVRMVQVVGNLLTNAAKYSEAGGHIWITAERQGTAVALRIQDNGIGIAPDMLPHIFELFVQADHTTTRAQGGLGIGLTLVKSLVEMHEGEIEAHSAGLAKGAEFVIRLPLVDKQLDEDAASNTTEDTPSAGRRLLVVDDNRDAATTLALLLRLQGHDVQVAHDGYEAIEIAKHSRPEMIFLDLGMPEIDGYEVARRIRDLPELNGIVLAALTGWGQAEDRRRTAEAGFDHHLVKPPELKELKELIASLERGH